MCCSYQLQTLLFAFFSARSARGVRVVRGVAGEICEFVRNA